MTCIAGCSGNAEAAEHLNYRVWFWLVAEQVKRNVHALCCLSILDLPRYILPCRAVELHFRE